MSAVSDILDAVKAEQNHVVTFAGTGQYASGGAAACGLMGFNAIHLLGEKSRSGVSGEAILLQMTEEQFFHDAALICTFWDNATHLEVEEIHKLPLFEESLELITEEQGLCGLQPFEDLCHRMLSMDGGPAAALITKTPEIVTLLSIAVQGAPGSRVLAVYDSHPRPTHPDGAGLVFGSSHSLAIYLLGIFSVDENILVDLAERWQALLLQQFSFHIFASRPRDHDGPKFTTYDSTIALLHARSRLALTNAKVATLEAELARLRNRVGQLERQRNRDMARYSSSSAKGKEPARKNTMEYNYSPVSYAKASRASRGLSLHGKGKAPDNRSTASSASQIRYPKQSSSHWMSTSKQGSSATTYVPYSLSNWGWFSFLAGGTPTDDSSTDQEEPKHDESGASSNARKVAPNHDDNVDDESSMDISEDSCVYPKDVEDAGQRENDSSAQATFDCGICMEELPMDDIAFLDECGHQFCRDDLLNYILFKLSDRRFPIFCPVCLADRDRQKNAEISELLALQVGLTEDMYTIWSELAMTEFAIILHCRQCSRSVFIDREDHEQQKVIHCPMPDCLFSWCKACQQPVAFGDGHSCDGTLELENLMKDKGYKHCPGCKTPISRTEGCAHMQCPARGCNTHFCYRCGDLLVRSASRADIQTAVENHYQRCQMFDNLPADD